MNQKQPFSGSKRPVCPRVSLLPFFKHGPCLGRIIVRILLIGGNGFVGRPLCWELINADPNIGVFHRNRDSYQVDRSMRGRLGRVHG